MTEEEQKIVAELDAQFGATIADIPERPSDSLPRMTADLKVESAYLERSAQSGRKQLVASCMLLASSAGEESVGKKYKKKWGLETEENWQWLKRDTKALELEPPSTSKALVTLCQQLTGICFTAQLTPNKDQAFPPNCFINPGARRHDLEGGGSGAAPAAATTDSNL